jgi:hypothetical protein
MSLTTFIPLRAITWLALVIAVALSAAGDARAVEARGPNSSRVTAASVMARYPAPDDWHRLALYGNRDFVDAAAWKTIVTHPDCDRATALAIFWKADPDNYLEFDDPKTVPKVNRWGYELISLIRQRWAAGAYTRAELAFDLSLDARPVDLDELRRRHGERIDQMIPVSMRVKLKGRRLNASGFLAPGVY